jgi:hypothetical protein
MTMGIMAQYMGGPRAGTAMMSLFQQFSGGVMARRQVEELERLGFLGPGEVMGLGGGGGHGRPGGHLHMWGAPKGFGAGRSYRVGPGGVSISPEARRRLSGALGDDPLKWVEQDVIPKMEAAGITDPEAQMQELFTLLGRQTTQRFTADMVRNFRQMLGERARIRGGMDINAALGAAQTGDVEQALHNVQAAWQELLYTVAGPQSELTISALTKMTEGIKGITEAIRGMDPQTLRMIAVGLATLGAALVGGGIVAILAALGPAGWITVGIIAFAGAIKVLADSLASGKWERLNAIAEGLGSTFHKIDDFLRKLLGHTGGSYDPQYFIPDPTAPFATPQNYIGPGFRGGGVTPIAYHPAVTGGGISGGGAMTPSRPSAVTGPRVPLHVGHPPGGGGVSTTAGPAADATPVPHDVLAGAAALLHGGGSTGELQHFMASQGYPKSGNWCGEFAASVVHAAGGRPPRGAAVAANWLNWGRHVDPSDVRVGDIAVRRYSRYGGLAHPGSVGSHVGVVHDFDVSSGTFGLLAGNQSRAIVHHGMSEYEFRRGTVDISGLHGGGLRHHFGYRGPRGHHPSPAIPPPAENNIHVHHTSLLDGSVVARSTVRHLVSGFNRQAQGSRLPDFTAIRPQSV